MTGTENEMLRLLVVEDSPEDQEILTDILKDQKDIHLVFQDDWKSAIEYFNHQPVDFMILDWNLPDATGNEILNDMMNLGLNIPVVVLTGLDDDAISIQSLKNGVQDYLVKGQFSKREILKSIRYAQERYLLLRDLEKLSVLDALTGLFNRRFLEERGQYEYQRCLRYKDQLSCLLIDIDHFKSLNDGFGYDFGDAVLKQVSSLIKKCIREVDIAGRYGGEELLVILPSTPIDKSITVASQLLKIIREWTFTFNKISKKITVSIGVSGYRKGMKSFSDIVKECDIAVHRAKNSGRNQYIIHGHIELESQNELSVNNIDRFKIKMDLAARSFHSSFMEAANHILNLTSDHNSVQKKYILQMCMLSSELASHLKLEQYQTDMLTRAIMIKELIQSEIYKNDKNKLVHKDLLNDVLEEMFGKFGKTSLIQNEVNIIGHLNEWYDGTGPLKIAGNKIPLESRILSVVSFYLTNNGRELINGVPRNENEIMGQLQMNKNIIFDPNLVDVLLLIINSSAPDQSPSILIVEDDHDLSSHISALLNMKFRTLKAQNGMEALSILEVTPVDLLLLDLNLPGIDGYEVLRKYRSVYHEKKIPVIIMTGTEITDDTVRSMGAAELLRKPFSGEELLASISKYVSLHI